MTEHIPVETLTYLLTKGGGLHLTWLVHGSTVTSRCIALNLMNLTPITPTWCVAVSA